MPHTPPDDPDRAPHLEALADALEAAARRAGARRAATPHCWRGASRRWFDHQHGQLVAALHGAAATARAEARAALIAEVPA